MYEQILELCGTAGYISGEGVHLMSCIQSNGVYLREPSPSCQKIHTSCGKDLKVRVTVPYNSCQSRHGAPVQAQGSPRKFSTPAVSLTSKCLQKCGLQCTKCLSPWLPTGHRLYQRNLKGVNEKNVSILKHSEQQAIHYRNE